MTMNIKEIRVLRDKCFTKYIDMNLGPLLEQIRHRNRYQDINGYNVLVNSELTDDYSPEAVLVELKSAIQSRRKRKPFYSVLADKRQGISFGLNPYTDWAISQLTAVPQQWHIFVAADYYSIGELEPNSWFDLIANPFFLEDRYWQNLWCWILGYYDPDSDPSKQRNWNATATIEVASKFIATSGHGFIFHNRIPYLRPPLVSSTDKDWLNKEWESDKTKCQSREDLLFLLSLLQGSKTLYCTSPDVKEALCNYGIDESNVVCFSSHPSYGTFKPYYLLPKKIVFPFSKYE